MERVSFSVSLHINQRKGGSIQVDTKDSVQNSRGIPNTSFRHLRDYRMWRRKKPSKVDQLSEDQKTGSAKSEICSNCIRLMQENSQLKEQLAVLQGEGKKKQYTINPTLYTFYKNNVQKNRISR